MREAPSTHACQRASGGVGPHHFFGTPLTSIGTTRSRSGSGQRWLHRFPSNAANGTTTPSRRRTPTPTALFASAAPAAAARTVARAQTPIVRMLIVTSAEYTPAFRGRQVHDA